ncbi:tRNA pseudouridine synthase B [Nitritalea halalkaliphila LW7]|uniref:tRNA pseudouridine synthase B n=1 Tax=Nitritalea halalkaliphila LW7 TaxID=1189621 RepID=I5C4K7_9BACT|nr:tRNA pseudouridine(55) synthase TruB [Nitritalea halalkaliphila]EIM76759.1 tRNA pseudouridine synthase B [Nitritalea halalkaliphila LW7]
MSATNPTPAPYGEVFFVNKPYTWTSFDVVKKIRHALQVKKVGHAGTLDPLATGLLIICAGKMTKQIESYMAQEKAYEATFVLGATTESFDLEKEVIPVADPSGIDATQVEEVLARFRGAIEQVPPQHSAIKVDGKRVYASARKGEEVELQPRPVQIFELELLAFSLPEIKLRIRCSKGTYIRSLARDIGEALGVGAYMSALVRTAIGAYTLADAEELPALITRLKERRAHADL